MSGTAAYNCWKYAVTDELANMCEDAKFDNSNPACQARAALTPSLAESLPQGLKLLAVLGIASLASLTPALLTEMLTDEGLAAAAGETVIGGGVCEEGPCKETQSTVLKALETCANESFRADTRVAMVSGSTVAISEIRVGDTVEAYDPTTGVTGPHTVTAVMVHLDPAVEHLQLDTGTIETTPNHPFFTVDRGWVDAGKLLVGEQVKTESGAPALVSGFTVDAHPASMWDLTIDGAHTFFVGSGRALVHNCDPANLGRTYANGTVVENPGIKIQGFQGSGNPMTPFHGLDQAITRGVSPTDLLSIARDPIAVLDQGGGHFLYLSGNGAIVLTSDGQVVTTWSWANMNPDNIQIMIDAVSR